MVYLAPESLQPSHLVVEVSRVKPEGHDFIIDYRVHEPFNDKVHDFTITVPRDVKPSDPLWDTVTQDFAELFPRKEHWLVYRDLLRTRIVEEVFKRTKKAKPKLDKEALRAKAAAAKAKASGAEAETPQAEQTAAASEEPAVEQVKELLAQAKEFERKATDAMLDAAQRKKAEMRARAFRAKAEKAAKDAGIDLTTLG